MKNSKQVCLGRGLLATSSAIAMFLVTGGTARGQQTTGVPCSPAATTTVDGKYLPAPPAPFRGEINLSAEHSKPCWQPTVVAPKHAPNILLIMTDDQGLRRFGHLWRRHPNADAGPDREGGAALHGVPFHLALLALTSGTAHRTQPSFRGLRRHHRDVDRLSRL